ncbi:MAG: EamA family transporter [Burkholderiales bacterium]|nr:EamA family transporter [Burkholderiales bacterium]
MELSLGVTFAVLGAGLLHAGWNALLKSAGGGDPLLDTATVVAGATVCALPVLPFVALPYPAAWPFVLASAVIHFAYYITLAEAYRSGDLSFAYPLMRGTAPLLVTLLGIAFLRELPSAQVMLGVVLISGGIVGIAFAQRHRHSRAAVTWALTNAAIIAVYSLVDGSGARVAGSALSYVLWMTFLEGLFFLAWIRMYRGPVSVSYIGAQWRRGLLGGFCSVAAYGIVLWAMTRAPIAAVAALRETSVLFATIIGTVLLKEGFGAARLAGAVSVVAGVAVLKL